ncbi:MAG: hypothetical protein QM730_15680 [Anaerolineales bacterium]
MIRFKLSVLSLALVLALSACKGTATPADIPAAPAEAPTQESATDVPPSPYTDTPAPVTINAPIVEAPALVTIQFLNELDGYGVTDTQIVRTNDGGVTWYNVTPSTVTEAGFGVKLFALDVDHVWMQKPDFANYPNSGFLNRTTDGGITWTTITVPFSSSMLTFLDENNGWALADLGAGAGSNAVAIYQTADGGANWIQTYVNDPNLPNAGDSLPLGGLKSDLVPLNMQTAYVTGVTYATGSVYLYRSDDGGHTWSAVTLPLPPGTENSQMSIESDQMAFVSANDGFLAVRISADTTQTAVYVTHDAGITWTLTPTLIPGYGPADFLSEQDAVLYNGAQFYVTKDAARTWNIIPPDIVFGESYNAMDFVNTTTGWLITYDPTDHRTFYKTTDGGATWFAIIP